MKLKTTPKKLFIQQHHLTIKHVKEIIQYISEKEEINVIHISSKEGATGFNYGYTDGDEIFLAPFRKI